jgi:hypothetical protein
LNRDRVTKLLKDYRSYRRAMQNYERFKPYPAAGIANYSGMPGGSGATELFFASNGRMADIYRLDLVDTFDYDMYYAIVYVIDATVDDVLSDNERHVIKCKWMDRNPLSLCEIAKDRDKDERTVRRWHREALRKLAMALAPLPESRIPRIEEIPA